MNEQSSKPNKRKRGVACIKCKQSHLSCNSGVRPCETCIRRGFPPELCSDAIAPSSKTKRTYNITSQSISNSITTCINSISTSTNDLNATNSITAEPTDILSTTLANAQSSISIVDSSRWLEEELFFDLSLPCSSSSSNTPSPLYSPSLDAPKAELGPPLTATEQQLHNEVAALACQVQELKALIQNLVIPVQRSPYSRTSMLSLWDTVNLKLTDCNNNFLVNFLPKGFNFSTSPSIHFLPGLSEDTHSSQIALAQYVMNTGNDLIEYHPKHVPKYNSERLMHMIMSKAVATDHMLLLTLNEV